MAHIQDFPGASGPITFDDHGDRVQPQIGIYEVSGEALEFLGFTHELLAQRM